MKQVEIFGMSIFGLLLLLGIAVAIRQGAKRREQLAQYAAHHGWSVRKEATPGLAGLVEEAGPSDRWFVYDVVQVEPPPETVYLFRYHSNSRGGSSSGTTGQGVLAEHRAPWISRPVSMSPRVPGLNFMVEDRVETGSEEFRREFTVTCEDSTLPSRAVNGEIQRVLLEHAAGPKWNLTVSFSSRAVVATSFWAQKEEEWDYLIRLTRRLREAVQ